MADEQINVKIGASIGELIEGMRAGAEAVEGATLQMKGALAGLNEAFETAMAPLQAFMAILSGGKLVGEAVADTVALNKEAMGLGKQLGVSANEAGQLSMALKQVGGSTEGFAAATTMLTRQIRQNEDGVKAMGLQTRNADGSLRNSKDLMLDAIEVLKGYREGTDRNMAAQVLFGRGASNLGPILKVNKDLLEEMKAKQEALGLTITTEGEERTKKYKIAMVDANEVMEAINVKIGNALMPALTMLADWFSSVGPAVVGAFGDAMAVLGTVIGALVDIVTTMWNNVSATFSDMLEIVTEIFGTKGPAAVLTFGTALKSLETVLLVITSVFRLMADVVMIAAGTILSGIQIIVDAIKGLITGGMDGMKEGAARGLAALEARFKESYDRLINDAVGTKAKFDNIWSAPPKEHPDNQRNKSGGTGNFNQANQDDAKAAQIVKGWENALAAIKAGLLEQSVRENQNHEMSAAAETAYWQRIVATAANGSKEKAAAVAKYEAARISELTKRYAEEKAIGEQFLAGNQAAELAALDQRQALADREVALGRMTNAEKIAADERYEADRYAVQAAGFNARLAILAKDPTQGAQYAAMLNQKLALDAQYQAKKAALETQAQVESQKTLTTGINTVSQTWAQNLTKMTTLQQGFAQTVQGMWQGMITAIANAFEQMLQQWLQQQLTALILGKTQNTADALSKITANAGVAGSAAFASTAAIPVTGPAMAPAAAAAAMAGAMSFAPMASAAGGFDIPSGVNPVTQLHQREMVLPADLADNVRNMTGGAGDVHFHISAMDARSFTGFLQTTGGDLIIKHLQRANRNFQGMR